MSPSDDWRNRLAQASEQERAQIIQGLQERAMESGHRDDANELALAYVSIRSFRAAAELWEQLLEAAAGEPEADVHRMSLATAYDDLGFDALSRYHYRHLSIHGCTEELRSIGVDQIDRLDHEAEAAQNLHRQRQQEFSNALQRAHAVGDLVDIERLAVLLPEVVGEEPSIDRIREIRDLLERSHRSYPFSASLLSGLLVCCEALDDEAGFERFNRLLANVLSMGAVKKLPIDTQQLAVRLARGSPRDAALHLLRLAQSSGGDLADAAASDLQKLIAEHPRDSTCVFAYGFLLLGRGQLADLGAYLDRIVQFEQPTHFYHFNAGQLFMAVGDTERGRRSLLLALRFASTDEDAADAREQLDMYGIEPD
jgi:tetratricopeptide (TPR) repeat protein